MASGFRGATYRFAMSVSGLWLCLPKGGLFATSRRYASSKASPVKPALAPDSRKCKYYVEGIHVRRQTKLALTAVVMVLALSAEGTATAQSAPPTANSASGPAPAQSAPASASDGPQLVAARASLVRKTKNRDIGSPVDLNTLANRQAASGNSVANTLALPSTTSAPIQSSAAASLQMLHGVATGSTSTTAGQATRVVPVGALQDDGPSTSVQAARPETVIRGQINPAARTCYENDPDSKTRAPGRLIVLIKVNPTGDVEAVTVASNVGVSPPVASCITTAARAAKFAAPGANGATVRAAFTFPPPESPAPPSGAGTKSAEVLPPR